MYKHYIRLNGDQIVHGFSTAFEQPEPGDIEVYTGDERHFNQTWIDDDGIYLFEYRGSKIMPRKRTQADIEKVTKDKAKAKETAELIPFLLLQLTRGQAIPPEKIDLLENMRLPNSRNIQDPDIVSHILPFHHHHN